ncbi:hypothetical protein H310_00212 [Aphanomyces invadans]|uniref:Uncharacterized protein n=1 Tax=Aphanomyces invadans TaxID=157072 RepID=A0A024UVM0_9STRA|nr:hypothetical protein H310_00212 [Aphanomyces invadans]ETW09708.1 hypothetical protein H310_00212 [Aphanomyces invadans]RHY34582.1 hypothetical protein DYB32_000836 [Aphanomyces invadans]|eukprot:XP_008861119.1 hypothetical protein H310_00212 [Aphanomyces invadans]
MMKALGVWALAASSASAVYWNQSAGYSIKVDFKGWSNFSPLNGGCVTCPYTCVRPSTGPDGLALNFSNASSIQNLPSVYSTPVANGCCYAKGKVMPSCNNQASPPEKEDCGFLYGPTLQWNITDTRNPPPTKSPLRAILMASTDCKNFWAVQQTYIKQEGKTTGLKVTGSKQINGGCYGSSTGSAIILAGCLTTDLKFDKSAGYSWDKLAVKCRGLSGMCTRTNALWGRNLECCTDPLSIDAAQWDLKYKLYTVPMNVGIELSGPVITGIVFGGVALLMMAVHFGSKIHQRAKQTALMREQELTDDYEEVMTPLTGGEKAATTNKSMARSVGPSHVEHSLHEGDQIYKKKDDEVLFEGDLY